jgi:hypothetical protein
MLTLVQYQSIVLYAWEVVMESLHLSPVSLKLLHGPLADQYKEERKLTAMLRDYGFGFLTDSDPDL